MFSEAEEYNYSNGRKFESVFDILHALNNRVT